MIIKFQFQAECDAIFMNNAKITCLWEIFTGWHSVNRLKLTTFLDISYTISLLSNQFCSHFIHFKENFHASFHWNALNGGQLLYKFFKTMNALNRSCWTFDKTCIILHFFGQTVDRKSSVENEKEKKCKKSGKLSKQSRLKSISCAPK